MDNSETDIKSDHNIALDLIANACETAIEKFNSRVPDLILCAALTEFVTKIAAASIVSNLLTKEGFDELLVIAREQLDVEIANVQSTGVWRSNLH